MASASYALPGSIGGGDRGADPDAPDEKLYLVVRSDLPLGAQLTQVAHGALRHALRRPCASREWERSSGSLITVAVSDLRELSALAQKAHAASISVSEVREHDLGYELTALVFAPGRATRSLLGALPLAGRLPAPEIEAAARARSGRLRSLVESMDECEQMPGLSVLAHGVSVWEHTQLLTAHLRGELDLTQTHADSFRLPSWLAAHREALGELLLPSWVLERYTVLHDCGKPSVRTVDDAGRVHFPAHAAASAAGFAAAYGLDTPEGRAAFAPETLEGLDLATRLVAGDMSIHLARAEDVPALSAVRVSLGGRSYPLVASQLIVALAEVTANAAMFGGISSSGFAMKFKHIERRGRAACKLLFPESSS